MGSVARKVADFRAAYLNEAAIEASRPCAAETPAEAHRGRPRQGGADAAAGGHAACGCRPVELGSLRLGAFAGSVGGPGLHGEKTNVAFLVQGGLGLPDREHYLGVAPRMQTLRSGYQACIGRMLTLAGFDHGAQRAGAVMALESAIAKSHATREESADDENADNLWTRADFLRQAPGMDWSRSSMLRGYRSRKRSSFGNPVP